MKTKRIMRGILSGVVAVSTVCGSALAFADSAAQPATSATVSAKQQATTVSAVYMRSEPRNGTAIVCTIPENAAIEQIAQNGNWYQVSYNGKTGYIYKKFLKQAGETEAPAQQPQENTTQPSNTADNTTANTATEDEEFSDVLGSKTTYYNTSVKGRSTNIRLAAEAIDGTVLQPGETFSLNGVVGRRTAAKGYQTAIIFQNGKQVEGLGGGVCQVSSTVYGAVLYADLQVTERSSHQFQVSYTPVSQDAAVYYGSQDFQFVNDTDNPIKIAASASNGSLTVTIYGTKTTEKKVTLSSKSSVSGKYKYASLYKTVTENGTSTTTKVNTSKYLLK